MRRKFLLRRLIVWYYSRERRPQINKRRSHVLISCPFIQNYWGALRALRVFMLILHTEEFFFILNQIKFWYWRMGRLTENKFPLALNSYTVSPCHLWRGTLNTVPYGSNFLTGRPFVVTYNFVGSRFLTMWWQFVQYLTLNFPYQYIILQFPIPVPLYNYSVHLYFQ